MGFLEVVEIAAAALVGLFLGALLLLALLWAVVGVLSLVAFLLFILPSMAAERWRRRAEGRRP